MKTFILLVLLLIIGWLTVPGSAKLKEHLQKKERTASMCTNGTRISSYKVFSIAWVDYCEQGAASGTPTRSDKYLGLFGAFWKISD